MKKSLISSMLLFLGIAAVGQDPLRGVGTDPQNLIGLAIGVGNIRYLDRNSSPLLYQSKPKGVRLFYNYQRNDFLFALNFDVRIGGTAAKKHPGRTLYFREENYKGVKEDKRFPVGGSLLAATVSVGAYYKIRYADDSDFALALGAQVLDQLFYPQGWTNAGLFNALSFAVAADTRYEVASNHAIGASARLPVVTHLTRLPYHGTVSGPGKTQVAGLFANSRWVGPAQYFAPVVSAAYRYQLDDHWSAGVSYEWSRFVIQAPDRMTGVGRSFSANFQHQF